MNYRLTCLPDDNSSSEDSSEKLVMAGNLPDSFSLVDRLPPIRDQGFKGCCVAHSITCMKEEQEYDSLDNQYLSPQFIYNLRRNRPQPGMYVKDALNIVKTYGILTEKEYPYDYDDNSRIPQSMAMKALRYRINGYIKINSINELKYALMECGPCPITFPVYSLSWRIWNKVEGKEPLGHHCMTVVGWNPEGFIIRNSWGLSWGAGGYVFYPYEDWGAHSDIWASHRNNFTNQSTGSSSIWNNIYQLVRKII